MSKLTLNIDERVIESGKDYARRNKTSLSRLVSDFLRSLDSRPREGDPIVAQLHRELLESVPRGRKIDDQELRRRHAASKYMDRR